MFPCENSKTVSVSPYPEKRNHPSFVNISPTLVIDTPMERSSRVLQHENNKTWFFLLKKVEIEFWLVPKSWNPLSFVNISPTLVVGTWLCIPPSVTGKVYCFPRRQLIFIFDRRVMYRLNGLWEYIPKSIPSVCTTIF